MGEKISMDTIAKMCGVSKYSVHKAFKGETGVSEETRQIIIDAANKLGYVPNRVNRTDKNKQLKICAILFTGENGVCDDFSTKVKQGIEAQCSRLDIILAVCYIRNSDPEGDILDFISDANGLICIGTMSKSIFIKVEQNNIPIIIADYSAGDFEVDYVVLDNMQCGYRAAKILLDKAYKELRFVGDVSIQYAAERWFGYAKAVKLSGLLSYQSLTVEKFTSNFKDGKRYEAVVASSDIDAYTIIKMLAEKSGEGYCLPAVISFGDIHIPKEILPELQTVYVPKVELGKQAVERLVYKIKVNDERKQIVLVR